MASILSWMSTAVLFTAYDAVAIVAERVPELAEPEKLSEEVAREVMERLSPTYGEAEVQEALDEIQYLIDAEELLTTDQYHDYVVDFKKRKTVVKRWTSSEASL